MNNLLLFFAFPVSTIILAIVVQKTIKNTFLTAATFFAIYLIVTFTFFDINFLVYTIIYTIIAYITAEITKWISTRLENNNEVIEDEENTVCYPYENRMMYNNTTGRWDMDNLTKKNQKKNCYRM